MNEVMKLSEAEILHSQLAEQIKEANQVDGYHEISPDAFPARYSTRLKLAEIEGKPEQVIIEEELDLIASQERKFPYGINLNISNQRIFLLSRQEKLKNPEMDDSIIISNALIMEGSRICAICDKPETNIYQPDLGEKVLKKLRKAGKKLLRRAEKLIAQSRQKASPIARK